MSNDPLIVEGFGGADLEKKSEYKRKARPRGLDEGDNEVRILPAMHSLAPTNQWSIYQAIHWGWRLPNTRKAGESFPVPFYCIQKRNSDRMVTVRCPVCDLFDERKSSLDSMLAEKLTQGIKEKQAKEQFEEIRQLSQWCKDHSPDRKVWMNAQDASNEFFPFKISYKLYNDFVPKLKKFKDKYNVDPMALETGVWWNFTRSSGNVQTMTDSVSAVYVPTADGQGERVKVTSLTRELALKALEQCPDLTEVARKLSVHQLQQIAACDEDPEVVKEIMGVAEQVETPKKVTSSAPRPVPQSKPAVSTESLVSAAPSPETVAAAKPAARLVAEAQKEVTVKAEATETVVITAAAAPTGSALAGTDSDEWYKQFE